MTLSERPDVAAAELEEPGPWRSPVPFLWLAVAMLLTGAVAALLTGAAEPPEGGEVFDVGVPASIDLPPEHQVGPFDPKDLFPPRPSSTTSD